MKLFSICQAILSACFGTLTITDDAISRFVENPQGKHRYLILTPDRTSGVNLRSP
jgi:hypothetical protein